MQYAVSKLSQLWISTKAALGLGIKGLGLSEVSQADTGRAKDRASPRTGSDGFVYAIVHPCTWLQVSNRRSLCV